MCSACSVVGFLAGYRGPSQGFCYISFGATASPPGAVPEPTTMAMWTLFVGGGVIRSYRNKKARK